MPCQILTIVFAATVLEWMEGSGQSVSLGTLVVLWAMWAGIQVPLVFLGSMMGFRVQYDLNEASLVHKEIPTMPWWLSGMWPCFIGGFAAFLAGFVQVSFIVNSIWRHSI